MWCAAFWTTMCVPCVDVRVKRRRHPVLRMRERRIDEHDAGDILRVRGHQQRSI
jgi:hypothetical protein